MKSGKKLKKAWKESVVGHSLRRISAAVYRSAERGVSGKILRAEPTVTRKAKQSGTADLLRRALPPLASQSWNDRLIRSVEQSLVLRQIRRYVKGLLNHSVWQFGIFFVSFGMMAVLTELFSANLGRPQAVESLWVGIGLVLFSIPALFAGDQSMAHALSASRWLRAVWNFFGFSPILSEEKRARGGYDWISLTLGLLTLFFPAHLILAVLALLLAVYGIFCLPELGVMALFLFLPFLGTVPVALLTLLTAISFGFKCLMRKRIWKIHPIDGVVLCWMGLVLTGGMISMAGMASFRVALVCLSMMLGYFLTANLIVTERWLRRCLTSLLAGAAVTAGYGILQYLMGDVSNRWQDPALFSDLAGRSVSTFGNPNVLGEYLLLTLPFALVLIFYAGSAARRWAGLFCSVLLLGCLTLTWSRGAWLGCLAGMLILGLLCSRRTVQLLPLGLAVAPAAFFLLPGSVIHRFLSIGNLQDHPTAYRLQVWRSSWEMLKSCWKGGVGLGTDAFVAAFPLFARSGVENALHSHSLYMEIGIELGWFGLLIFLILLFLLAQNTFSFSWQEKLGQVDRIGARAELESRRATALNAAAFSAIFGFAVQGFTDYVFYNYRIYAMFWLILGLSEAIRRGNRESALTVRPEYDA